MPRNKSDELKKARVLQELKTIKTEKTENVSKRLELLKKSEPNPRRNMQIKRIERLLTMIKENSSSNKTARARAREQQVNQANSVHLDSRKGTSFLDISKVHNFEDHDVQMSEKEPTDFKFKGFKEGNVPKYKINSPNYQTKDVKAEERRERFRNERQKFRTPGPTYKLVTVSPLKDSQDSNLTYTIKSATNLLNTSDSIDYDRVDMLGIDPRSMMGSVVSSANVVKGSDDASFLNGQRKFTMKSLGLVRNEANNVKTKTELDRVLEENLDPIDIPVQKVEYLKSKAQLTNSEVATDSAKLVQNSYKEQMSRNKYSGPINSQLPGFGKSKAASIANVEPIHGSSHEHLSNHHYDHALVDSK